MVALQMPFVAFAQNAGIPSLKEASLLYGQGKEDEALRDLNLILEAQSNNLNAHILRGAVYSQQQLWDNAEKDYEAALQLDPTNDGVLFDIADLKFKQVKFDEARQSFVSLPENRDPDIKDLIAYKIFLCDLLGGRDDMAAKELDVFNLAGSNPSYYYGNAAWNLVHKKPEQAKNWLVSASHIYFQRKQSLYTSMLTKMGYLPLQIPDSK